MYRIDPVFGCEIWGKTIGNAWISLIKAIIQDGNLSYDEERQRLALGPVRIHVEQLRSPDPIIHQFADHSNLQKMIELVFSEPVMVDIDKTPSFRGEPKSYFQRIQDGKMIDFIVQRLTRIPESKKAVMIFPTYEDYEQVLNNPKNDYLPCLVSLQFRLIPIKKGYRLNTIAFFRSIDVFQKASGNFETIAMLAQEIQNKLEESGNQNLSSIESGNFDVLITDAHLYENTLEEARELILATAAF